MTLFIFLLAIFFVMLIHTVTLKLIMYFIRLHRLASFFFLDGYTHIYRWFMMVLLIPFLSKSLLTHFLCFFSSSSSSKQKKELLLHLPFAICSLFHTYIHSVVLILFISLGYWQHISLSYICFLCYAVYDIPRVGN